MYVGMAMIAFIGIIIYYLVHGKKAAALAKNDLEEGTHELQTRQLL